MTPKFKFGDKVWHEDFGNSIYFGHCKDKLVCSIFHQKEVKAIYVIEKYLKKGWRKK